MCDKKCFDKVGAMFVVAKSQRKNKKNFKRREIRVYFCGECKAWHTTSTK